MIFKKCSQQNEIATAIRAGRWPLACDPALRAHAEQCRQCSDFVVVAQALSQARTIATENATLPSPGQLWWKAQLQRRQREFQRVSAPVNVAGIIAMSVSALAGVGLVWWQRLQIIAWISQLAGVRAGDVFASDGAGTGIGWIPLLLIAGMGTLALFAMLVVYLALQRE